MKDDIQQLFIENRIPVFLKEPSYEERLKKKSHKARKNVYLDPKKKDAKLACLEWGNAGVVFQIPWGDKTFDDIDSWAMTEYAEKNENFNIEVYQAKKQQLIEIRYMCEKPYYKTDRIGFESVHEDIKGNVLLAWEMLPESIRELVELCYLSDWDYLEFGEEI